jgi:hypothetical protein
VDVAKRMPFAMLFYNPRENLYRTLLWYCFDISMGLLWHFYGNYIELLFMFYSSKLLISENKQMANEAAASLTHYYVC